MIGPGAYKRHQEAEAKKKKEAEEKKKKELEKKKKRKALIEKMKKNSQKSYRQELDYAFCNKRNDGTAEKKRCVKKEKST